jgi:general secretion pathway protein K
MALLYTLWTVSLVAVLVAGLQDVALTRAMTARTAMAQAQAMALADGALALGLLGLIGADPASVVPGNTTADVAGVPVRLELVDEGGKIDLNRAPPALLDALGQVAGAPGFGAGVLAVRAAAPPSRPAFTLPEEIARLPGLTEAARRRLLPALTTLSRSETVDAAVAGPLALRAATGAAEADVARFLATRSGRLARYPLPESFQGTVLGAGYRLKAQAIRGTATAGRILVLRPLPLGERRGLALVETHDLAADE